MSIKYHQKCYQSPSKETKTLPTAAIQGYEKGCFFTYRGEDTGYFYTATGDRLSVFQSNGYIEDATLSFTIDFGATANVIDCIYFPLNETSPGLVVAVHDPALTQHKYKFYLAYVSLTKKRVLKKVAAPGQVNSLANIIDGSQYPSQVHGLNPAFQKNWPHIIGVSIYESGAALTHLAMSTEDEEHGEHCHKATNVIILGKTFLNGEDGFVFQDDQGRKYSGKRSNFYVSKFAFIERCAIVIMGFPFGGIYMVSLRTQRPYSFFMAEGVIEDCAIQDADDDPRGFFYLWFALSRGDKAHALSAYAIFPEEDEKRKCYDNPQFVFSINFTLSDFMSFLSLKTMLVDRSRLAGSPKDADAMNESVISNNKSSSLALFTWLSSTKPTRVYGALFDLNMYYFKRTPSRLSPDDTELRQIPFCSGFQTNDSVDVKNMEIFDIVMMPNSLRAFISADNEDKDQLFYPSVYSFTLKSLTRKNAIYLNVDSIQDQFLKEVSMNFVEHWSNPTDACTKFHALGIGALPYESNDKRYYQLSALLKHAYHFCIIDFILDDQTPVADLKFLLKWLNKEVEVNKENLDRFCQPLLDGGEVSHTAMHFIKFSEYLFYRICQIIDALIERISKIESEETFLKHLKIASSVANGIHLYSTGIKFGLSNKMLPQHPESVLYKEHKKAFNEQWLQNRSKSATLSIIKLIQECMDTTPDSSVWENKTPQQWYPPQSYSTWLGIFLMVNLSKTAKSTLFGYYLCDLVKRGLSHDDKLLDKGLGYLLLTDGEKLLAIKRRIDRMYKCDERIAKMETDEDIALQKIAEDMRNPQEVVPKSLNDFCNLPLMDQKQIDIAKEYFMKIPYGIHYWNKSVLEKRRYELILRTDPPNNREPQEVKEIRQKIADLERSKPFLFKKNNLLSAVEDWLARNSKRESTTISRKMDIKAVPSSASRKRTIDEVITAEEDAFPLATPIKQGRKSIFADTPAAKAFREFESGKPSPSENDDTMSPVVNKDIDDKLMTDKQWEKIKQITKTPPATPLVSRLQYSPEPSSVKAPTSILKSNKKESRITSTTKRVKLQFDDNLSTVKSIPNRHEQRTPVPDAFTMEDSSIISENGPQDAPAEEDYNMEEEENDEYGPTKLNFDNIDDEEEDDDVEKAVEENGVDDEQEDDVKKTVEENAKTMKPTAEVSEPLSSSVEEAMPQKQHIVISAEPEIDRTPSPSPEPSMEATENGNITITQKSNHIIQVEYEKDKTPSRESSMEAPETGNTRKSSRLRKSSINAGDNLSHSQPVKSMESIAEVSEPVSTPRKATPIKRKTPSRASSVEAPVIENTRKSSRLRTSSINAGDNLPHSQPVKSMKLIAEVSEPLSSYAEEWRQKHRRLPPIKRVIRKTPSRESSIEAPEDGNTRKSSRLRKSSINAGDNLSNSQPVKSMESIVEVSEPVSTPRKATTIKRKTPSRTSSIEAPEVGNTRKSPRLRTSSINAGDNLPHSQPVKSMESIAEVTEPVSTPRMATPIKRKTPSRASSVEAPAVENTRKSPRKRKSSINAGDNLLHSQPVKSMESIAEVTEPTVTPRGRGRPKKH